MARYAAWKFYFVADWSNFIFFRKWRSRGPSEYFARCVKYNMLIYGESTKKLRGHSAGRSRVGANTEESGHKQHKQNGHPSEQKDNKRVGKDTSWAQRHKSGHKDIECAQRHRVGTKSQRVQKDRVVTNAASSHTHECAQAEWVETTTRDRERSKWHKPAGSTQTTQASRVDTSRVDTNTEWIKTWVDANTESGKIIWEDQAPKRIHTNSGQQHQSQTGNTLASEEVWPYLPITFTIRNYSWDSDVCTNSQSQQTLIIQATRLHQRKYVLTFLKCLQSGIIRGTRSLHKLAEWRNSHRNWDLFIVCEMIFVRRGCWKINSNEFDWKTWLAE